MPVRSRFLSSAMLGSIAEKLDAFLLQFFYESFGRAGEFARQVYFYADIQVAALAASHRHAFAFYLQCLSVCNALRDIEHLWPVQCFYFIAAPEQSIGELD